jgi:hydroxyacylglutathione hydrolase
MLMCLELSVDKSDIERLPINLNEKFSPSTLNYTATVEASYTDSLLVAPKLAAKLEAKIKINDVEAKSGVASKIQLRLGENKIMVEVAPSIGEARTYQLNITKKDLSKEYWSEPLGEGVWRIQDFGGYIGNEDMYLFEGKERALLIDTGMGRGDLASYVAKLTEQPVDVALTHGHLDHFLQVDQFPEAGVYISESDAIRLPPKLLTPRYRWVKRGDVIDIGTRKFEVLPIPGHTPGSVLYVDFEDKIAVTGDAISSGSMGYMFAPTCAALDEYLYGLKQAEDRLNGLKELTLYVSHHYQEKTPLRGVAGKQLITDMRIAAERVLSGEADGRLARTMRDGRYIELRQLNYGLAGLWYNPKNLNARL